jgi:hypothetical protein
MKWFNKKVLISVVCSLLLLSSGIVYGKVSIPKQLTLTSLTICVSSEGEFHSIKELTGACKPKDSEITLKGEQGAVGPSGPIGPQGIKGDTGAQGPTGTVGADGQQGKTGDKGEIGAKGDSGVQGVAGPAGPQGVKGDTGAEGPQGPEGDPNASKVMSHINYVAFDGSNEAPGSDKHIKDFVLQGGYKYKLDISGSIRVLASQGPNYKGKIALMFDQDPINGGAEYGLLDFADTDTHTTVRYKLSSTRIIDLSGSSALINCVIRIFSTDGHYILDDLSYNIIQVK